MFKLALKIWSGLFLLATLGVVAVLAAVAYQVVKMDSFTPTSQVWSPPASDSYSDLPVP